MKAFISTNLTAATSISARSNHWWPLMRIPQLGRAVSYVFVCAVLVACTPSLKNLPKETEIELPNEWQGASKSEEVEETEEIVVEEPEPEPEPEPKPINNAWLGSFEDPRLNNYVQAALINNPDLWASATQLKSALEEVRVSGSALWPTIAASLNTNRIENDTGAVTAGVAAGGGATFTDSAVGANNVSTITTEIRTISATLNISWEADIWGKLTQRKRADVYNAQAQAELFKAAELSLVAGVSRAWYNLVTTKLQLDVADKRLASFVRTAAVIDENYQRGLRSALDVYLSRSDVEVQKAQRADSEFDYLQAQRTLKTLLGEYPEAQMQVDSELPELNASVAAGLPAQLLTRRPDIKASQLRYKATRARAAAAQRDLYPSLTFNGSIGDSRETFAELFDADNMILTLASGLVAPIFASGALRSRRDQAGYQAESAYANLVSTALTAFEEVENALSQEALLIEQREAITKAVDFAQGGLDLALDQYKSGIADYTTVLESQRRLFDSLRNQLNIKNALVQNRISLHLALGGSFTTSVADEKTKDRLPEIPPSEEDLEKVETLKAVEKTAS